MLQQVARWLGLPWPAQLLVLSFWALWAFATYMALAPVDTLPEIDVSDLATHGLAFFVLSLALCAAYFPQVGDNLRQAWRPLLWLLLYGIALELIQALLPTRAAELKDLLVDVIGICSGLLLYRWLGDRIRRFWFVTNHRATATGYGRQS